MENSQQATEKRVFIPNKDSKRKPKSTSKTSKSQKGKKWGKQKKERLDVVHDGSQIRHYWKGDKNYITSETFKNELFPPYYTKRLLELEKLTNTNRRKMTLELLQLDKLENQFFISDVKDGKQVTIILDKDKEIVNQQSVSSTDDFRAIVKAQGINHTFVERDAFELWLMRRYQVTTFEEKRARLSKQHEVLANVQKIFYETIRPDVLEWMEVQKKAIAHSKHKKARRPSFKDKQPAENRLRKKVD